MRAEQLAVQPGVRGEKRTADAKQHAPRVVGTLELGAIPDRLAALMGGELPRHLYRLPPHHPGDRGAVRPALATRHPYGLPPAKLADAAWSLRKREEKTVAQLAMVFLWSCANAPSAVVQKMTSRFIASANAVSWPASMRARMLPPKPAPMMRAPRHPWTPYAFSTSASTFGVDTSKSSRRLRCDSLRRTPRCSNRRSLRASTKACTRAISDSTCLSRLGLPVSASRRRSL